MHEAQGWVMNITSVRTVTTGFLGYFSPAFCPIKILQSRIYVNYALCIESQKLTKLFLGDRKIFPKQSKCGFRISGVHSALKIYYQELRPQLINMPNIFPPNSFKYDFKFSIHTCCLQKGWVIDRSVNEPLGFQLLQGLFLRLVPKLEVLLFQKDVPFSWG